MYKTRARQATIHVRVSYVSACPAACNQRHLANVTQSLQRFGVIVDVFISWKRRVSSDFSVNVALGTRCH